jgi:hypothetical protein
MVWTLSNCYVEKKSSNKNTDDSRGASNNVLGFVFKLFSGPLWKSYDFCEIHFYNVNLNLLLAQIAAF